jgi:ribose/xylose/arabinose/galactoside ABC-type transport system permease subunit
VTNLDADVSDSGARGPDFSAPRGFRWVADAIGVENLSLLIALGCVIAIIAAQTDKFFLPQNLLNSLGQNIAVLGLVAVGQTVIIVAASLDISVGSIAGVASVVAAIVVGDTGVMQFGLAAGVLAGFAAGLVNGLIISFFRVNSIIATLGTLAAFKGLAFLIAPDGKPVGVGTEPTFTWLGSGRFLQLDGFVGIPVLLVILVAVALAVHLLMRYTTFGRAIYAIGGNPKAAHLAGIDIRRVQLTMFAMSGAIAGLAGVLITARTTAGNPSNGQGLELQAITAVFLGGAATSGGKGTIVGTILAVLLIGVLQNGMNLLGVNTFYQDVARGLLLIGAVAISQWRSARAERARVRAASAG